MAPHPKTHSSKDQTNEERCQEQDVENFRGLEQTARGLRVSGAWLWLAVRQRPCCGSPYIQDVFVLLCGLLSFMYGLMLLGTAIYKLMNYTHILCVGLGG